MKGIGGKMGGKTLESEGRELHRTCQTFQPQFSIFFNFANYTRGNNVIKNN